MPTIITQNAGAPVKLPDTILVTKPGEISHYEHFSGREGIRQAVPNIMSMEALDNLLSIDGAVYPNMYFLTDKIGKLESISSNKVHIVLKEDTSAIISS